MSNVSIVRAALLFLFAAVCGSNAGRAADVGTAFTYQGQLENPPGTPLNDTCTFQFKLCNDPIVACAPGTSSSQPGIVVTNGIFTVGNVDFGAPDIILGLNGTAKWMEIAVDCPTISGGLTVLSPRVELKPTPFALALPNFYIRQGTTSPVITGGSSSNNASHSNGGTISGGGTSSQPNIVAVEFGTVGGGFGNSVEHTAGTIAGGSSNRVFLTGSGSTGGTIGGGASNFVRADYATIAGGFQNEAFDSYSTIGGGAANKCDGESSTVSGGSTNSASGYQSTVGGGYNNTAQWADSVVGGGISNSAGGNNGGASSTIAGGESNATDGNYATVGGGWTNQANKDYAVVAGGGTNTATGNSAVIGGGSTNNASGANATVPGGSGNVAGGDFSFAAGHRAKIRNAAGSGDSNGDEGTFVWADSTNADFTSTGANQFLIRASGGVGIGTTSPLVALHVSNGSVKVDEYGVTAEVQLRHAQGTSSAPTAVVNANILGRLSGAGYDGTSFSPPEAIIDMVVAENWTSSAHGTFLRFDTTKIGGTATGERMRITDVGDVGIGTTSPDAALHVQKSAARVVKVDRGSSDGELLAWARDDIVVGNVTVASGVVSYNAFTGSHYALSEQPLNRGMLAVMTGHNQYFGATLESEIVYGIAPSSQANDPQCLGAFLSVLDANQPPSAKNPQLISAVGNGDMWVVDSGRDIHPGDYLVSSSVKGHAMLDDAERFPVGYIVARAGEPVEWSRVSESMDGHKHKRVSVFFENFERGSAAGVGRLLQEQQKTIEGLSRRLMELESTKRATQ